MVLLNGDVKKDIERLLFGIQLAQVSFNLLPSYQRIREAKGLRVHKTSQFVNERRICHIPGLPKNR